MKPGDQCPECGHPIMFACGIHGDHRFIHSHRCVKTNRVLVACTCGQWAWGKDTDEAVAAIGGTR